MFLSSKHISHDSKEVFKKLKIEKDPEIRQQLLSLAIQLAQKAENQGLTETLKSEKTQSLQRDFPEFKLFMNDFKYYQVILPTYKTRVQFDRMLFRYRKIWKAVEQNDIPLAIQLHQRISVGRKNLLYELFGLFLNQHKKMLDYFSMGFQSPLENNFAKYQPVLLDTMNLIHKIVEPHAKLENPHPHLEYMTQHFIDMLHQSLPLPIMNNQHHQVSFATAIIVLIEAINWAKHYSENVWNESHLPDKLTTILEKYFQKNIKEILYALDQLTEQYLDLRSEKSELAESSLQKSKERYQSVFREIRRSFDALVKPDKKTAKKSGSQKKVDVVSQVAEALDLLEEMKETIADLEQKIILEDQYRKDLDLLLHFLSDQNKLHPLYVKKIFSEPSISHHPYFLKLKELKLLKYYQLI